MAKIVRWDEETREATAGAPQQVMMVLRDGLKLRDRAKTLEDEAKALKERANDMLKPAMVALGLKKVSAPGWGRLIYKEESQRPYFNKQRAKEELLGMGVSVDVVARAFDAATEMRTTSDSVEFKRNG